MNAVVVIERRDRHGSIPEAFPQKVAAVYLDGDEYNVYAPPSAVGEALEWVDHFRVHQTTPEGLDMEIAVESAYRALSHC